jgi:hypothetical protein
MHSHPKLRSPKPEGCRAEGLRGWVEGLGSWGWGWGAGGDLGLMEELEDAGDADNSEEAKRFDVARRLAGRIKRHDDPLDRKAG